MLFFGLDKGISSIQAYNDCSSCSVKSTIVLFEITSITIIKSYHIQFSKRVLNELHLVDHHHGSSRRDLAKPRPLFLTTPSFFPCDVEDFDFPTILCCTKSRGPQPILFLPSPFDSVKSPLYINQNVFISLLIHFFIIYYCCHLPVSKISR